MKDILQEAVGISSDDALRNLRTFPEATAALYLSTLMEAVYVYGKGDGITHARQILEETMGQHGCP